MSSYKAEKEAFHAGNPGSSITSINAVSAVSLTSYMLYALLSRHLRLSPVLDYLVTVFPLLLGVTVFSSRPYIFNLFLLLPSLFILSSTSSTNSKAPDPKTEQSKGKWLDESDSDEEPAQPVSSSSSPTSTSQLSPDLLEAKQRTFRRRHSPTPSTHTHTAIDIDVLTTPDLLGAGTSNGRFATRNDEYPSRSTTARGSGRLGALSVYRAQMMIMTVLCILAVDFEVFPRWQGKCEDFGTSLMDIGVGSFVFSLGLVSVRNFTSPHSLSSRLVKATAKASPVLALGIVRVLMVKGTEYPEHVTEYGVHWNFFFTLGLLPILGTLLASIRQKYVRWSVLGVLTTIAHQLALRNFGLQSWVLSPMRDGILGANKEGIVSLPGYLAIYFLGLATGEHVARAASVNPAAKNQTREDARRHFEKRRTELGLELFGYAFGWWVVLFGIRTAGGEISRRLANTSYVIWTAAYNTTFLLGYLIVEIYLSSSTLPSPVPPLLEAINANGLAVFLVANLLTGLVNVSVQTMYLDTARSMVVLVVYSASVCALAWGIRRFRIKI
ncbi:GWT1-domain-containing protein [Naematelia encephala]|uniref:GPI-anchored wall transfer protein n=1 Tax=Naematelia encephala TaxID=71784 RepID=A0A1Y2AVY0_9TREE|nr:GWT1-domain-containing protein [Naematelia encephala]